MTYAPGRPLARAVRILSGQPLRLLSWRFNMKSTLSILSLALLALVLLPGVSSAQYYGSCGSTFSVSFGGGYSSYGGHVSYGYAPSYGGYSNSCATVYHAPVYHAPVYHAPVYHAPAYRHSYAPRTSYRPSYSGGYYSSGRYRCR